MVVWLVFGLFIVAILTLLWVFIRLAVKECVPNSQVLWIARDWDGRLWMYDKKPVKGSVCWDAPSGGKMMEMRSWILSPDVDPSWRDVEPKKVVVSVCVCED